MTEQTYLAAIAAGAVVLASAVTGFFTYFAAVRQRDADRNKRRLLQAYKDMLAFYRLEEQYAQNLATQTKSAEAIKREKRKRLRESGIDSPSENATPQQIERRIQELP